LQSKAPQLVRSTTPKHFFSSGYARKKLVQKITPWQQVLTNFEEDKTCTGARQMRDKRRDKNGTRSKMISFSAHCLSKKVLKCFL
jgi:hypothetical protein